MNAKNLLKNTFALNVTTILSAGNKYNLPQIIYRLIKNANVMSLKKVNIRLAPSLQELKLFTEFFIN